VIEPDMIQKRQEKELKDSTRKIRRPVASQKKLKFEYMLIVRRLASWKWSEFICFEN